MTSIHCNLRLSDVHATADTVGREFKQLTDKFGMECVMGLLAPVVRGLEWLEAYVESYQHLQTRLSELQMENDTVVHEREQRAVLAEENKVLLLARRSACSIILYYDLVILGKPKENIVFGGQTPQCIPFSPATLNRLYKILCCSQHYTY